MFLKSFKYNFLPHHFLCLKNIKVLFGPNFLSHLACCIECEGNWRYKTQHNQQHSTLWTCNFDADFVSKMPLWLQKTLTDFMP